MRDFHIQEYDENIHILLPNTFYGNLYCNELSQPYDKNFICFVHLLALKEAIISSFHHYRQHFIRHHHLPSNEIWVQIDITQPHVPQAFVLMFQKNFRIDMPLPPCLRGYNLEFIRWTVNLYCLSVCLLFFFCSYTSLLLTCHVPYTYIHSYIEIEITYKWSPFILRILNKTHRKMYKKTNWTAFKGKGIIETISIHIFNNRLKYCLNT